MPETGVFVFSALVVLGAGFIRGYSGFGFSMITVLALSLVSPPSRIVPAVLLWEIAASLWLLPSVWRRIDWPSLAWLFVGVCLGTPLGVYFLANMPARPMRAAISLAVIVLAALLAAGFKLKTRPGRAATTLAGAVSGVFNGAAAIGGPPAILFYFSTPTGIAVGRASLIAFFLATDLFATGVCLVNGLVDGSTLFLAGPLLPFLALGVALGGRSFSGADEQKFRTRVLRLLMVLSAASLVRSLAG
ncbi:MAG: sulfite exporter TauE/SafE family protein [Pseudomonadota bacterium]